MATKISLTDLDSGASVTLNDRQRDLVLVELRRVRRFGVPDTPNAPPIAADCKMEIEDNGQIRRYLVLHETVLLDVKRRRLYQFYMGLQLMQWLKTT